MTFKKFGYKNNFRRTFKGNWKCADCQKEIGELPFKPSEDRPVYCRECWQKKRSER